MWKEETHRWINPHTGEEHEPDAHKGFPTPAELESGTARNLKASGAVRVVSTPKGDFVVKDGADAAAKVEVLSSTLAQLAGAPVPRATTATVAGKPSIVQDYVPGKTVREIQKESPELLKQKLQSVPKADIDRTVLFDYLLGNTDVHNGNYLLTDSGRMVGIDKELVLGRGNLKGQRFEPPHFLALSRDDGNGTAHPFDKAEVAKMAQAGEAMAKHLEAGGARAEARQVRDRAVVLAKMAAGNNTTAGELARLGREGVTPPNLGLFAKAVWHLSKG